MTDESLAALAARVDQLERDNRRLTGQARALKRGATVVFAVAVVLVGAGAIATRDAVVVEDPTTGKRLVDLVALNTGAGGFQVWDRADHRRILLGTNHKHFPGLTMWDEKGRRRILIGINDEGVAHVTLWDQAGKETVLGIAK